MKWIGQHIYDLVARFRNDVYLEDLSTTTETNVLVVDSDGKVSKTTVITGDVTGVTAGSNITVTDPTGPVPTVALNTSLTGLTSITSTSFVGTLTGTASGNLVSGGALGTPSSGDLTNCTFPTLNQSTTGNADTATKIESITNSDIVQLDATQTLTLKTLFRPTIEGYATFEGSTSGTTKLEATAVAGTTFLTLPAATDTLVGKATADTLTNKTLFRPLIQAYAEFRGSTSGGTVLKASAVAGITTLTLPAATDKLVGANTIDVLTNKTLTAPTITGAGAIAGVFTGNITGNVTGNADTVTTNADLTGPVTSTGNITAIASGAITTAMQKHLQTFEFNGYSAAPASTNYFIPALISENKGPFLHSVDAGAGGVTALTPAVLSRSGGKVMPYAGTCKLWKGWIGVTGLAAFKVSIFKYTPVPNDATPDSLVLVKEFSDTADGNNNLIAISEDGFVIDFDAGDILITGISCASGATAYFTSTLEVEWN
jgi:trimeric autotransporter adhesin